MRSGLDPVGRHPPRKPGPWARGRNVFLWFLGVQGLAMGSFLVPAPAPVAAQSAVVDVEENFRTDPNGTILGVLHPGTPLTVLAEEDNWLQVTVGGYVWTRSMQVLEDGELNLVISEPDGENLRAQPQGRVTGRLVRGAQLEELERIPGWVRVQRTGWIWAGSASTVDQTPEPPAQEDPPGAPPGTEVTPPVETPASVLRVGPGGLEILGAPDGGRVGQAGPGAQLHVLAREGGWVRVQLEGWVRPPGEGAGAEGDSEVATRLTVADIRGDPDRYRGRMVEVQLQFISLESAEAIRTDFYEGEPFLLTRAATGERSFAYVALPPERVGEVERLSPLEDLLVTGRVRTGGAEFTGNPVLDLVRFERLR